MKQELPLISIVTVCYNSLKFIEKTIRSVLAQDYPRIEYIVIDGGSTDGTVNIINRYANKINIFVSEPDNGIYDAMNKGVQLASGEWICFMNSSDTFGSNDNISKVFNSFTLNDSVVVVYGDSQLVYTDRTRLIKASPLSELSFHMPFCHQSTYTKRQYLKEHPFDTHYKIAADYSLYYQLFFNRGNCAFLYVPILLSICDATDSLCQSANYKHTKEKLEIRKENKNLRWWMDWMKLIIKGWIGYDKT